MQYCNTFVDNSEQLCIVVNNQIITRISQAFLDIFEYSTNELINKNINEVFAALRIGPKFDGKNFDRQEEFFLFTKSLEVRFINIEVIKENNEQIYIFREKNNSRLENKFPVINNFMVDNKMGVAIYTAEDLILLKANQFYLNLLEEPFTKKGAAFGMKVSDFADLRDISELVKACSSVISTRKSFYGKELKIISSNKDNIYINITMVPVVENDKLKFILSIVENVTEIVLSRKRNEEQVKIIKQHEKELEVVLENLVDGVAIIDKYGNYKRINRVLREWIADRNLNEIEDIRTIFKYYDIEGKELTENEFPATRILRGEKLENENFIMKEIGKENERYISISGTPIYDENCGLIMGIISLRDVTEKMFFNKKIEEQAIIINKQKELLETTIENMNDPIVIYNEKGSIIYKNAESRRIYPNINVDRELKDSYGLYEIFDMDNNVISMEKLPSSRVFRGEKIRNERIVIKFPDKSRIMEVNAFPVFDSENRLTSVVVCHHDVSKIIERKQELRRQKELLEVILENIQEGIVVFDKNDKYIEINRAAKKLFNITFNELGDIYDKVQFYDFEGNKIQAEEMPSFRVKLGETVKDKIVWVKFDDKEYYLILSGTPIFNDNGEFIYGVITGRNITDFLKSEKQLKATQNKLLEVEMERNEALEKAIEMKDEFLSVISHEFRTPLNVINTAIQTLNTVYPDHMTNKVKDYIKIIRQNTNRQLRLVNNLLDITRANAGRINIHKKNADIVFLTKAIAESVHEFALQKGVNITFTSDFDNKIIGIDDEKYERIILNLLSNAIKFTPKGKFINISLYAMKDNTCIEVKDAGIGIPADKIDVIFDRFGQVDSSLSRQAEGTGIGLSLVKKFVEALGGSISVKSKIGKGTSFIIMLHNEKVIEEQEKMQMFDLMDNRLIQATKVEFSDIYL